jgi:hypothetical protein
MSHIRACVSPIPAQAPLIGLAHRRDPSWKPFTHKGTDVDVTIGLRVADRIEVTHVGACTKCSTTSGQYDHADGRVRFGGIETGVQRAGEPVAPGVHPLWSVQGQDRDAGFAKLVGHGGL